MLTEEEEAKCDPDPQYLQLKSDCLETHVCVIEEG
jgi:hypothetical protein